LQRGGEIFAALHQSHAFAATARTGFDEHGIPDLIRLSGEKIRILIVAVIPRRDRHPGFPANNPDAPYLAFIGPDDAQAGRQIANALMDAGVKKMVAIGGLPGSSMAEGRKRGLDEAVAQRPDVQLVQYFGTTEVSEEGGYRIMQNLLAAHPKGSIDGLWCYNDGTCLGAFRAVRQARRANEISIAAMDLEPQALDLIAQNSNYIYSTGGHWLQIGFGVLIAFDKVNGHDPLHTQIGLDLLGVKSDSFAKFRQQFIDNNPPYDVKQYSLTFNPQATQQTFPLRIKE